MIGSPCCFPGVIYLVMLMSADIFLNDTQTSNRNITSLALEALLHVMQPEMIQLALRATLCYRLGLSLWMRKTGQALSHLLSPFRAGPDGCWAPRAGPSVYFCYTSCCVIWPSTPAGGGLLGSWFYHVAYCLQDKVPT